MEIIRELLSGKMNWRKRLLWLLFLALTVPVIAAVTAVSWEVIKNPDLVVAALCSEASK